VEAAMQAVESDSEFLKVGGIFDDTLIQTWKNAKLKEAENVNQHPSPFEIENYYDC
jgi:glutamine synthetase